MDLIDVLMNIICRIKWHDEIDCMLGKPYPESLPECAAGTATDE